MSLRLPKTVVNYQALFESSPAACLILTPDLNFTIIAVNDAYLRITMTERDAIIGRGIFDVFPDNPDDNQATGTHNLRASLESVLRHKKSDTLAVQKYDIRRPEAEGGDFEERYWSPINSPVFSDNQDLLYIIHRAEDVTGFVRLKQQEIAQQSSLNPTSPTFTTADTEVYLRAKEIEKEKRSIEEERNSLERRLWQAQKMEAIGNLTGGMAHDFNNMLGIVIGNLDLLENHLTDTKTQEFCRQALDAALRGANLTQRLLAFARQQPLQPRLIEVNKLVAEMMTLLERTLGEDIQVTLNLGNVWPVTADPAQLEASLTNLANNARDAMPKGGILHITTDNRNLDEDYAAQHPDVIPGNYVVIEVSDTGKGIPPEIIDRIFDPFFTTKERDKGTGLGLSMVFGFIKQSHGHINVYSEYGVGTIFRLYLPRAAHETATNDTLPVPSSTESYSGGDETILVVEDNEGMRAVVVRQLTELGYKVLQATHGKMALDVLQKERVDLLLSDVVMPGGLDGYELVKTASDRYSNLKILLTSGFPETKLSNGDKFIARVHLLRKPYRKVDLATTLRKILEHNQA